MLIDLGFNPHCCWALIEVDMRDLVTPPLDGDVDILIGQATWNDPRQFDIELADHRKRVESSHPSSLIRLVSPEDSAADMAALSGALQWPPSVDYVVGVEVKCSRLDSQVDPQKDSISEDNMKSTKSSRRKREKIRLQIEKLAQLGFNRVALLDLISNPPADGINLAAWLNAFTTTDMTERAMSEIFGSRLAANSPAGHWVYSVGAVVGGDETMRGTGYPRKYRAARENTHTPGTEVYDRRRQMEQNVTSIFNRMRKPTSLPMLFINCRVCKAIHECAMNAPCCQ